MLTRPSSIPLAAAPLGLTLASLLAACGAADPPPATKAPPTAKTAVVAPIVEPPPPAPTVTASAEPEPPKPPPPDHVVDVVTSDNRACAVYDNGMLQCWGGFNSRGELGAGDMSRKTAPAWVKGLRGAKKVMLADERTCAIVVGGDLHCWGTNDFLETDARDSIAAPAKVAGLSGVVDVAGSRRHACAVLSTGAVYCWGDNQEGQVGVSAQEVGRKFSKPTLLTNIADVVGIAASDSSTVAWTKGGDLYRWGTASDAKRNYAYPIPKKIDVLSGVKRAVVGDTQTCAVLAAGEVRCFTHETLEDFLAGKQHDFAPDLRKLIQAFARKSRKPIPLPKNLIFPDGRGLKGVSDLIVFNDEASAVTEKGEVWSWGAVDQGTGGKPAGTKGFFPPAQIAGVTKATAIVGSFRHRCELEESGEVRCFGEASQGLLGSSQAKDTTSAVPVSGLPKIAKIASNDHCTFALGVDHSLWVWGTSWLSSCGLGDDGRDPLPAPVKVPLEKPAP